MELGGDNGKTWWTPLLRNAPVNVYENAPLLTRRAINPPRQSQPFVWGSKKSRAREYQVQSVNVQWPMTKVHLGCSVTVRQRQRQQQRQRRRRRRRQQWCDEHDRSTRSATVYNNGAAAAVYPDGSEARKSAPLVFVRCLPGRFPAAVARLERTPTPFLPPLHSYRTRGCPSIGLLSSLSLLRSLSRRVLHKRTPPLAAQPYFYLTHRTLFYSEMIWKRVIAPSWGKRLRRFHGETRGSNPCVPCRAYRNPRSNFVE